jgi:outer membrane protein
MARFGVLLFVIPAAVLAQAAAQTPVPDVSQASVPRPPPPAAGAIKLTLAEAEQLALKNNPQIAQAQFEARAYDEITREFRAAYFPTLEGDVTAVRIGSPKMSPRAARLSQVKK